MNQALFDFDNEVSDFFTSLKDRITASNQKIRDRISALEAEGHDSEELRDLISNGFDSPTYEIHTKYPALAIPDGPTLVFSPDESRDGGVYTYSGNSSFPLKAWQSDDLFIRVQIPRELEWIEIHLQYYFTHDALPIRKETLCRAYHRGTIYPYEIVTAVMYFLEEIRAELFSPKN